MRRLSSNIHVIFDRIHEYASICMYMHQIIRNIHKHSRMLSKIKNGHMYAIKYSITFMATYMLYINMLHMDRISMNMYEYATMSMHIHVYIHTSKWAPGEYMHPK